MSEISKVPPVKYLVKAREFNNNSATARVRSRCPLGTVCVAKCTVDPGFGGDIIGTTCSKAMTEESCLVATERHLVATDVDISGIGEALS